MFNKSITKLCWPNTLFMDNLACLLQANNYHYDINVIITFVKFILAYMILVSFFCGSFFTSYYTSINTSITDHFMFFNEKEVELHFPIIWVTCCFPFFRYFLLRIIKFRMYVVHLGHLVKTKLGFGKLDS